MNINQMFEVQFSVYNIKEDSYHIFSGFAIAKDEEELEGMVRESYPNFVNLVSKRIGTTARTAELSVNDMTDTDEDWPNGR